MPSVVVDTHAAIWYVMDAPELSARAGREMDQAVASGFPMVLPTICLVEMVYLIEKGRIAADVLARIENHLAGPHSGFFLTALTGEVARAVARISRAQVPDMPDRIIAATALALELPLVTRDARLQEAQIETIW